MVERLRELLAAYEQVTEDLNSSIDKATNANNLLVVAKSEVSKNRHKRELIQEQIMCEKKLIDATR